MLETGHAFREWYYVVVQILHGCEDRQMLLSIGGDKAFPISIFCPRKENIAGNSSTLVGKAAEATHRFLWLRYSLYAVPTIPPNHTESGKEVG